MQVAPSTGTAQNSGVASSRARRWIEAQGQSTSNVIDELDPRSSENMAINPATSPASYGLWTNDINYRLLQEFTQLSMNDEIWLTNNSVDISTPIVDYIFKNLETASKAKSEVRRLFSLATFVDLEPGMTNEFSEGLEEIVERYGELALLEIQDIILNNETASSIASEALKYIGNTDSKVWQYERRLMLETCLLNSNSVWARDGAGLGLSFLGDPKSVEILQRAIQQETSQALKKDLTQVLYQLEKLSLG